MRRLADLQSRATLSGSRRQSPQPGRRRSWGVRHGAGRILLPTSSRGRSNRICKSRRPRVHYVGSQERLGNIAISNKRISWGAASKSIIRSHSYTLAKIIACRKTCNPYSYPGIRSILQAALTIEMQEMQPLSNEPTAGGYCPSLTDPVLHLMYIWYLCIAIFYTLWFTSYPLARRRATGTVHGPNTGVCASCCMLVG